MVNSPFIAFNLFVSGKEYGRSVLEAGRWGMGATVDEVSWRLVLRRCLPEADRGVTSVL